MDVTLAGTGGPAGWPQPGCRCASCARARRDRVARAPAEVLIDGVLRIALSSGGPSAATLPPTPPPAGYQIEQLTGGVEVTTPDGGRLLCASWAGAVPAPPDGAGPYHVALLDLLGDPAQLGWLRRRGLVTEATAVAMIHVDHRAASQQEIARRCRLWRITPAADGDHLAAPAPQAQAPQAQVPQAQVPQAQAPQAQAPQAQAPQAQAPQAQTPQAETPQAQTPQARPHQKIGPPRAEAPPGPWRVLLLGGASSGKSAEAELRLAAEPEVTYVAAAGPPPAGDPEWAARVAAHRARRPAWWHTAQTTDLAAAIRAATGAILIDSIGSWLAAVMDECGAWHHPGDPQVRSRLAARVCELARAWRDARAYLVAVTDEVGAGVVPQTSSGRIFRDELGRLNQMLAAESDEAALVVAGRVLPLPG